MTLWPAMLLASIAVASACGGQGATSPTTVTTPVTVTDTFTGTLSPLTILTHTFNAAAAGSVSITLTAAGPPDTIQIGLGAGTPTSTSPCNVEFNIVTAAGTRPQISGAARSAGPLCIVVFDSGNLSADIIYSVNVTHP